ncbi:hypothetical protein C8N46_11333 [Kordia periserrulae]|uniref:Uncharacterized protein n=1 Tax=Kordia periserrulae TaxID=701523 RepID=A0A2T6BR41_9FLAO|nr:hypothetical protein [Kordia periserrulae]PTX58543.1 hypothetical protein C8N46_11333 [Kordia periserrulae]
MEDFDYIDELAKKALSDRTETPSKDGWNAVQQQMAQKKRKKAFLYIVLLLLICSFGIFIGVSSMTDATETSVSNKNAQQTKATLTNHNATTIKDSSSISSLTSNATIVDDASRDEQDSTDKTSETTPNQHVTTNNFHGEKNGLASTQTAHHSRLTEKNNTAKETATANRSLSTSQFDTKTTATFFSEKEELYANAKGVIVYEWELIAPEILQKKRSKQTKKKPTKIYEQLDLMVGFNGFAKPNDYNFIGSYVFELSYTGEKKLNKNYFYTYGGSLQFRNLRFKQDSLSFNRGELSLNIHTGIKRGFGEFAVEAGGYVGYELYSPNNEFFNNNNINFFDRKINYGLFSVLHYKKVGLVFKYEFSPYINYLGAKQFGAFTVGVKYDF